jgi:hypothetical protein
MFAKYVYNAGTQANFLSDIVALMTGESNKNNLSSMCNKDTTTITSTLAAGWTVHDASAGTNKVCVKALLPNSVDTYKYVVIDTNNATYCRFLVYETWDNSAHTGTNLLYASNTETVDGITVYMTTVSGVVYLSCSQSHIAFSGQNTTATVNSLLRFDLEYLIADDASFEFAGCPATDFAANGTTIYVSSLEASTGVKATGTAAAYLTCLNGGQQWSTASTPNKILTSSGLRLPMYEQFLSAPNIKGPAIVANASSLSDIYVLPGSSVAPYSTFTYSGKLFTAFPGGDIIKLVAVRAE